MKTSIGSPEAKAIIEQYVYAKDYNRPYQMHRVFCEEATLEMRVNSESITFPPITRGREGIAELLSRQFGATYDNVYTLCISDSVVFSGSELACRWLVVMTHKEEKTGRVGFGSYDWRFSQAPDPAVQSLIITIDEMNVIEAQKVEAYLAWINQKNYPWSCWAELVEDIPEKEMSAKIMRGSTNQDI